VLAATVQPTPGDPVPFGRVSLPAGRLDITVGGTTIKGQELLRLRGIRLTPVAAVSLTSGGR
jgi:hypothetical protein